MARQCPSCDQFQAVEVPNISTNIKIFKCYACGKSFNVTEKPNIPPTQEHIKSCKESRDQLVRSGQSERLRQDVLNYITHQGSHGATCREVEIALNKREKHSSVSCTIKTLKDDGFLVKNGFRENAETGRRVAILIAKQFANGVAELCLAG